jgi:hypothetical protein
MEKTKMKKKSILIVVLCVAMIFTMALAGCSSSKDNSKSTKSANSQTKTTEAATDQTAAPQLKEAAGVTVPDFSVKIGSKTVTNKDLATATVYSCDATSTNSSGTTTTITFQGFKMSDVFAAAGIEAPTTTVDAIASDGYKLSYGADQINADTTLLAVTQNGAQFVNGPWIAPCADKTTGDYMKDCVEIDVAASGSGSGAETENSSVAPGKPEMTDATAKVQFAPFSFKVNGTAVTNDTLKGLKIYKCNCAVTDKSGQTLTDEYAGYVLSDVLKAAGVTSYGNVTVVANDGYKTTLDKSAASAKTTILAIEKDKAAGEKGTVYVAPMASTSSKDYAKLVVEIDTK